MTLFSAKMDRGEWGNPGSLSFTVLGTQHYKRVTQVGGGTHLKRCLCPAVKTPSLSRCSLDTQLQHDTVLETVL